MVDFDSLVDDNESVYADDPQAAAMAQRARPTAQALFGSGEGTTRQAPAEGIEPESDPLTDIAGAGIASRLAEPAAELLGNEIGAIGKSVKPTLTHYSVSPKPLESIEPKFMGRGSAGKESLRGAERIPRSYYYESNTRPEDIVLQNAKTVHTIERPEKILDLASTEAKPILEKAEDLNDLESKIHAAGYEGYKNSQHPNIPNAVAVFTPQKPIASEAMSPEHFQAVSKFKLTPTTVKINPEHGRIIADAYEAMKHDPSNPEVKAAYNALIDETKKQFEDIKDSGLKISRIQPGQPNPYKNSAELHADIDKNNHLWYYPTEQGFGSSTNEFPDHPMLKPTEFKDRGEKLLANDVFRIVHDVNGHNLGGKSGFGPKGEQQAYLQHKKMYSPLAQKALATETMGQNNWVNWSKSVGEHNRANPSKTVFADQKAGLLPDKIINGDWHNE